MDIETERNGDEPEKIFLIAMPGVRVRVGVARGKRDLPLHSFSCKASQKGFSVLRFSQLARLLLNFLF